MVICDKVTFISDQNRTQNPHCLQTGASLQVTEHGTFLSTFTQEGLLLYLHQVCAELRNSTKQVVVVVLPEPPATETEACCIGRTQQMHASFLAR